MNNEKMISTSQPFYVTSEQPQKLNEFIDRLKNHFNFKRGEPLRPGGIPIKQGDSQSGRVWISISNKTYSYGSSGVAYDYPFYGLKIELEDFEYLFSIIGRSHKIHTDENSKKRFIVIAEPCLVSSTPNGMKYGIIRWFQILKRRNPNFCLFLDEVATFNNLDPKLEQTLNEGFSGMETVPIAQTLVWCYNMERSASDTVRNWQEYFDTFEKIRRKQTAR